jgi:hypothetical protein
MLRRDGSEANGETEKEREDEEKGVEKAPFKKGKFRKSQQQ